MRALSYTGSLPLIVVNTLGPFRTGSSALQQCDERDESVQGHSMTDRMVERYVRDVEMFRDNAATSAGL